MTLQATFPMMRNQQPIVMDRGMAQKDWFLFFTNLYTAVTDGLPQPAQALPLPASPGVLVATIRGQAHIGGGTVSLIEFSRDGRIWYDTGITRGFVTMDRADSIRVTYTVVPTITFFPM